MLKCPLQARAAEQEVARLRQQLADAHGQHKIEMEEKDSQLQQMVAREAKVSLLTSAEEFSCTLVTWTNRSHCCA